MKKFISTRPLRVRFSTPGQTLFGALRSGGSIHGIQSGFDDTTGFISRQELIRLAVGAARIVIKETRPGETIGLILPNVASTLAAVIGIGAAGRVPAMLNYSSGLHVMREACVISDARFVLTSRAFVEKAGLVSLVENLDRPVRYIEDLRASLGALDKAWIALAMLAPGHFLSVSDSDATAVVLFTSGSEGNPKAVALSHRALLSNVDQVLDALDLSPSDVVFNALPIFHSFGLTVGTLLPAFVGMRSVLYISPMHFKEIPKLIAKYRATILFGTNSFFSQYAKHSDPQDLSSLKFVVAGAERLTDEVRQIWIEKFGIEILEGYGCTETAPVLAVNLPRANRIGSVGQLLAGLEAQLVESPDLPGQSSLHVRGPNLMRGYLDPEGAPKMPSTALGSDWYDTGDIVRIDDDGFIFIQGRAKRFAKIAGESVSLAWTERIAGRAYPMARHAAISVVDAHRGEKIVLFTTQQDALREALVAAIHMEMLPEISLPREIVMVQELPLLGTGKIDYRTLAEWVGRPVQ